MEKQNNLDLLLNAIQKIVLNKQSLDNGEIEHLGHLLSAYRQIANDRSRMESLGYYLGSIESAVAIANLYCSEPVGEILMKNSSIEAIERLKKKIDDDTTDVDGIAGHLSLTAKCLPEIYYKAMSDFYKLDWTNKKKSIIVEHRHNPPTLKVRLSCEFDLGPVAIAFSDPPVDLKQTVHPEV